MVPVTILGLVIFFLLFFSSYFNSAFGFCENSTDIIKACTYRKINIVPFTTGNRRCKLGALTASCLKEWFAFRSVNEI